MLAWHSFFFLSPSATVPPIVKVSPHSQIEPSMMDVKVRCHAEGVPKPTISWQINNVALPKEPHHYELEGKYVMTASVCHVRPEYLFKKDGPNNLTRFQFPTHHPTPTSTMSILLRLIGQIFQQFCLFIQLLIHSATQS